MLAELDIHNFAIIDSAKTQFGPGLNAITGETGAGKSILIDALGAVLGERVSPEMVRAGARHATIDATFDLARMPNRPAVMQALAELDIDPEEGMLLLGREIHSGGRSGARINGRPTTAAVLSRIGSLIVDVHGQSEHLSLLRPSAQLDLLDRYGKIVPLREEYAKTFGDLHRVRNALSDARFGARERTQRLDLLRYQVEEIERANLRTGEEEELTAERSRLVNADRIARDAASTYEALTGSDEDSSGAAVPSLRIAAQMLDEMAGLDPGTEPLRERLNEVLFSLEDFAIEMRDYRDAIEADPARLAAVEERLDLIRQLKRKYGADVPEVLAFAEAAQRDLEDLTGSHLDADALVEREAALAKEAGEQAAALSRERRQAASTLAGDVELAIADLKMGSADFEVSLEQHSDRNGIPIPDGNGRAEPVAADASGIDQIAFLIAPNVGEGLKPLSKIASGGETARLMLALKSILSEVDQTPTLIFDEIDVGVGGRSGQVVGEKLWRLAEAHQVIVITHLPQIAAFAEDHFRIAKIESQGRVVSTVQPLGSIAREEELAAMIDGYPVTKSSMQKASEMLRRAESLKARAHSIR
jgi:DNA repair protein RecN (Recombination protein N)